MSPVLMCICEIKLLDIILYILLKLYYANDSNISIFPIIIINSNIMAVYCDSVDLSCQTNVLFLIQYG